MKNKPVNKENQKSEKKQAKNNRKLKVDISKLNVNIPKFNIKRDFNKVLMTDTKRTVEKSVSRFISIIAIVALGMSFFVGMNATAPDMIDTAQEYYKQTNLMDINVQSTVGLTQEDLNAIAAVEGVQGVSPSKTVDGILSIGGERLSDIDGSEYTVKVISLNISDAYNYQYGGEEKASYMNRVTLVEGSWPAATNECLVDASSLSTPEEFKIGETITIESDTSDLATKLNTTEYKIVGIIRTPLYVSYERGYTDVGAGKLGTFIYIPEECFTMDYYTSIGVKVAGSENYKAYTKAYDQFIEPYTDKIQAIAQAQLAPRVQNLYNQYSVEVANGRTEYETMKNTVDEEVQNAKKQVEDIKYYAVYGDELINQLKQKYNENALSVDDQVNMAKLEQTTQYAKWEEKNKEYLEAKAQVEQYADAETQYSNAYTVWSVANNTVQTSKTTVESLSQTLQAGRTALDQFNASQDSTADQLIDRLNATGYNTEQLQDLITSIKTFTAVGTAEEISAYMEPELQRLEMSLAAAKTTLEAAQNALKQREQDLKKAEQLVEKLKEFRTKLAEAETQLAAAKTALDDADYQIQFSEQEALNQLLELRTEISNMEIQVTLAKERAPTVDAEYEVKVAEVYEKLDKAKYALEEGEALLEGLDNAQWLVTLRDDSVKGYTEYEQSANRVAAISRLFPWMFFLVAAMVSLNTMTRMVEEDRIQIGTLKALGFVDTQIMVKYLIYSLSASVVGSVMGSIVGSWLFPTVISKAFSMLFDVPDIIISYRWLYSIIGFILAVSSTVIAAYSAVVRCLQIEPSILMRPKAPEVGTRIFLEKIDKIWSKLNFSTKVTCRNVFRNKKRMVMVIGGVAGCTALLVAGFGLSDSIGSVLANQFESSQSVCKYDVQIVLKNEQDIESGESEIFNTIKARQEVQDAMLTSMKVLRAGSAKSDNTMEVNMLIPADTQALSRFVELQSSERNGYYTLGDKGCIITNKLASTLNIGVGDQILIPRDNQPDAMITVTGIVKNYTFHYIYISPTAYANAFGERAEYNYVTATLKDEISSEQKNNLATDLMLKNDINAVAYTSQIVNSFENIITSLNYVVIIIVVSAALLAFIVLYNLSNININERFKEIATLKVLGFNRREVSAYVANENWILTTIGTLIGLIAGIPLHRLVVSIAEVDVVTFGRDISFMSFVYAILLSLAFTGFVNLIMRIHLKKIGMVESLKSIE